MRRDLIDFHTVNDRHQAIHARLQNWGLAQRNSGRRDCASMFRGYRAPDDFLADDRAARIPVDQLDASDVQKGLRMLPEPHRHALQWAYVWPFVPAWRVRRWIGVTEAALLQLVIDGRDMLVNRRV